jgi:hypothetical protein
VLPCRNSAAYLPVHLDALAGWIDLAEEVVVVDSASTDGTVDLLRRGIRHPRVRFLEHPPGLYASWNFGIGQVQSSYTYLATVGDRISRGGLIHLHEVARDLGADVVISPPRFVGTSGEVLPDRDWPVFRLLAWFGCDRPRAMTCEQAFAITALMLPSGALGSSASNLYRTDMLRLRPLPTDHGHVGDTAWTLLHGLDVRWALTPERVAEFLVHPSAERRSLSRAELEALRDLATAALAGHAEPSLLEGLGRWWQTSREYRAADRRLHDLRSVGARWLLNPRAYVVRARRNRLRAEAAALGEALRHRVFGAGIAP